MNDRKAIIALAKLTHVNLAQAMTVIRHNPLLGDEIHIEEELINLEEAIHTFRMAGETLDDYPDMKQQLLHERRLILKHCFGLVLRMLQGKQLPRTYTPQDTQAAVRKLIKLIVVDIHRSHVVIDENILASLRPFVAWHVRFVEMKRHYQRLASSLPELLTPKRIALLRS